jgi:flagellar secretion chaperone FliS
VAMSPRGAEAYRRTEAQSSSPLGLVVMLYDGAIKFTLEAREAIARDDVGARTTAVSRALAIIAELQNTLNVKDGGEVARELDRLYAYMSARLFDVTARADDEAAKEVQKLLTTLREGWSQIAGHAGVGTGTGRR